MGLDCSCRPHRDLRGVPVSNILLACLPWPPRSNHPPNVAVFRTTTWGAGFSGNGCADLLSRRYWAKIERAEEHEANKKYVEERGPMSFTKVIKGRFSKGIHQEKAEKEKKEKEQSKAADEGLVASPSTESAVTEEEWRTAARALRTASWGTIFYLITTDILGWSSCP